jgi:hypothetical protein
LTRAGPFQVSSLRLYPMKAGHLLATNMTGAEFDLTERERIRRVLIDYMKAHKIGVPTLAARIKASHPREMEIPWKTLQRFLGPLRKPLEEAPEPATKKPMKPARTRDMALIICKTFVEKLPNKPTAFQALGQALHALYKQPLPPDIAGPYDLNGEYFNTMLSISARRMVMLLSMNPASEIISMTASSSPRASKPVLSSCGTGLC